MVTLPEAIKSIVHPTLPGRKCDWLGRLLNSIRDALTQRDPDANFFPEDYGLSLENARPAVHCFDNYVVPGEEDYDRWIGLYTSVAVDIVEEWLAYPTTGNSRYQAIFVLNLVQTLGVDILLLDTVWEQYQAVTSHLVRSTFIPEFIDITEYPVLDPGSQLRKNVEKISRLVEDYISGRLYRYVDLRTQAGLAISYSSEGLRLVAEERARQFRQFIYDCFVYLFRGESLSNVDLKRILDENEDKFSPFREFGPTMVNMRKSDGPFSPDHLQTVSGLFSALVCRGITFGTVFSRRGRTVFHSPQDFDQAVAECSLVSKPEHYCDPGAYGQSNHKRSPDLARIYWDRLHKFPWDGLTTDEPIPFWDAYRYFCPNGRSRFLELGPLGGYLLTVDYVYSGLVSSPSFEELAELIYKLNKGPANALDYLVLVPELDEEEASDPDKCKEAYTTAFLRAYDLLKSSIPGEYHREAKIDIFTTEHALCKFGRATKRAKLGTK